MEPGMEGIGAISLGAGADGACGGAPYPDAGGGVHRVPYSSAKGWGSFNMRFMS